MVKQLDRVMVLVAAIFFACAARVSSEHVDVLLPGAAQPRSLDAAALQAWYGDKLDLKKDAQLTKDIQRAEALVTNLLLTADSSKRLTLKQELIALKLPPLALRAVMRYGQIPSWKDLKKGEFNVTVTVPTPGFKDMPVNVTLLVPKNYTQEKRWPVILSLHGAHGNGGEYAQHWLQGSGVEQIKDFIVVAPTAIEGYGWGPSTYGRAQVSAALNFVASAFRTDPERVYIEGCSMGGVGTKRLAAFWPDRFAAMVTRAGPPIPPQQAAVLRNLHALPWLSFAGAQDEKIAEKYFIAEKELATKEKLPATMEIFPDRGHESFEDKDKDVLNFFASNTIQRAPDRLRFVSFEDGGGQRHHYAEITATDTFADSPSDEIVLNNSKIDEPLLKQMQTAATLSQYEAFLKQAKEKGLVLESKKIWSKGRELDLHVDRVANAIVIDRTAFVKQARFYVDDDVVDMDKEIVVRIQDRILLKKKVERSIPVLIDELLKSGRRDVTYWGSLDVRL